MTNCKFEKDSEYCGKCKQYDDCLTIYEKNTSYLNECEREKKEAWARTEQKKQRSKMTHLTSKKKRRK